jgi:hypothetical protein
MGFLGWDMEEVNGRLCVLCERARCEVFVGRASGKSDSVWGGVSAEVDNESAEVDRGAVGRR